MRLAAKIVAVVLVTAALISSVVSGTPTAASGATQKLTPSALQQLQTERAQLVAQLDALLPKQNGASSNLSYAESNFVTADRKVIAARNQLSQLNTELQQVSQALDADQKASAQARGELAQLAREQYETTGDDALLAALTTASDFSTAITRLKDESHANSHIVDLENSILGREKTVAAEQAQLKQQFAQASDLEGQLQPLSDQFLSAVEMRNQQMASASAPVRDLEARIAAIDSEIDSSNAPAHVGSGSCADRFAYGQCTWYVATRRCIPWSGNANQWYGAAAAMGYNEGHVPVVGAVVVFWPGGDGASGVGHVGYVEAVGPDNGIPPGDFRMSEMNFGGWGRVNYRILPGNSPGIQGFIYDHR